MDNMDKFLQINRDYQITTVDYEGRNHLVLPVIMMVEGVHNGNQGPLYHSAEELGAFPESWNGIPVVVDHPEREGQNVSANSPDVLATELTGRVFNTRMDGERLRADVYVDEERLQEISPLALAYIREGSPLEVSVGMFSEDDAIPGVWKGEQYNATARNMRPDHLALLPEDTGACSWDDGCGIRANNKKKGEKNEPMKKEDLIQTMKDLSKEGYSVTLISNAEQGLRELVSNIQSKLDVMDTDLRMHFLQEVYEDYFVYSVRVREGGEPKLYKRNYSVDDGKVEFEAAEPTEVRKEVSYVTLKEGDVERTKFSSTNSKIQSNMSEKKDCPTCEKLVTELIANKRTKFEEKDKEWLLTLEENRLAQFIPNEPEKKEDPKKEEPKVQVRTEPAKAEKKAPATAEEFIATMPEELQDQMNSGLKLHKEQREKMVKTILTNTEDVWTEERLNAMEMEDLTGVYKSVDTEVADYSLNDDGISVDGVQEPLLPPQPRKVELEKA